MSQVTGAAGASGDDTTEGVAPPSQRPAFHRESPEFDAIYQEHSDLAWRTLRRYGVPDASIDDAIQDVFMVVHTRFTSFEGRSSLRTWIFGIARRVARDHRPSARAQGEGVGADSLEALPDVASKSPLATLEAIEGARLLESLLAALAPKKREVFILVELEQMTVLEASQALGLNPNTVSSRLRAARQDLEQALARLEAHNGWRQRCPT
jgi:RNA polymerase sigma-70 factor (ECF subfamily)